MATVTVPTTGDADIILASNYNPSAAVIYQEKDATPVHTFQRANVGATVTHLIAGRQAPVQFKPLIEGRSDVFNRTIITALDVTGTPVGAGSMDRWAFVGLWALIEDPTLPYVALLDGRGLRWYAGIEFVSGSFDWRLHEHLAEIKVTEVAFVPTALETSSPPTP